MDHPHLKVEILAQPDDYSCGPTCLHAIYRYHGREISLEEVIEATRSLKEGGTLAVVLGNDALRRGYRVTLYTLNLHVFDPTWFSAEVSSVTAVGEQNQRLIAKLRQQMRHKRDRKLHFASRAYIEFLELGGHIRCEDLTANMIRRYLQRSLPIITGLSSTWLYREMREFGDDENYYRDDDIRGLAQGHFVVLAGYDRKQRIVHVADPYLQNPLGVEQFYDVSLERLINSILLGVLTYDANLLIIEKSRRGVGL